MQEMSMDLFPMLEKYSNQKHSRDYHTAMNTEIFEEWVKDLCSVVELIKFVG
jgi:hypothetical protein